MKEKFTKGPWVNNEQRFLIGSNGGAVRVSGLDLMQSFSDSDEHKANAHLMKCAPNMYEMLESTLFNEDLSDEYYNKIESLLKRARGE